MTSSQTLISATIAVTALHILISFILFLGSMSNLGEGKLADKERKSFTLTSGIFWLVSLLACITILVLVVFIKPKNEKTPCPIQLSEPGDSDRADIEDFINVLQDVFPDQKIPNFDSSRTYLVVTGFYKQHLSPDHRTLSPDYKPDLKPTINPDRETLLPVDKREELMTELSKIIQNKEHVPIGYIKDDVIYGLGGQSMFNVN